MTTTVGRREAEHTAVTALLDTETTLRQGSLVFLPRCGILLNCNG